MSSTSRSRGGTREMARDRPVGSFAGARLGKVRAVATNRRQFWSPVHRLGFA